MTLLKMRLGTTSLHMRAQKVSGRVVEVVVVVGCGVFIN